MYLNAKKLSFLGLLLAFTVILVILGGVIEANTFFLLAAASFCIGIAIRESGLRMGFGFFLASVALSFLIAPNKFYGITFTAMGLYLVVIEYTFHRLTYMKKIGARKLTFWIIKYITFNCMYIPIILFLPRLFYQGDISTGILSVLFLAGQIGLFVYDRAYSYFQKYVWEKLRNKLRL